MSYHTNRRYWIADHLILINDYLMDVVMGRIPRLMIFLPPRHGKSSLVSKYFSAWYMGVFARLHHRVILTSYEATFAASWGAMSRDVIAECGQELFGVTLKDTASHHWSIVGTEAELWTAGARGALTGKGANVLIIDDPIKNSDEAFSETYRNSIFNWYQSTASTRLEPQGKVVVIQTRWHEDDLSGRLLRQQGSNDHDGVPWTVLSIPAICEDENLDIERQLGRKKGQALWPARYDEKFLAGEKHDKGDYWWAAMYQQRPGPLEGGHFKKRYFKHFTKKDDCYHLKDGKMYSKKNCRIFAIADLAASEKKTADYTVIGVFAITSDNDLLVLHIHRERLVGPDQPDVFRQIYTQFNPAYIGVEAPALGLTMIKTLQYQNLPVQPVRAESDKVSRAISAGILYKNGRIYHLENSTWLHNFEEELMLFPNAAHDDQVDVISYAAIEVAMGGSTLTMKKLVGG